LVGTLLVCADSLTIHFHLLGRGAAGPSGTRVNPSMGLIAASMLLKVPLGPTAPRPSTIAMSERKGA